MSTGSRVHIEGTIQFSEPSELEPTNLIHELIPDDWFEASFDYDHTYYITFSAESFMYKLAVHRIDRRKVTAEWERNESIPDDDGKPKELSLTYNINGTADNENSWLLRPLPIQEINE